MSDELNNELTTERAETAVDSKPVQASDTETTTTPETTETKEPAKRAPRSRRKSVAASAPAASAPVETAAPETSAPEAAAAPAAGGPAASDSDAAAEAAPVEKPKRVRASRRKSVPVSDPSAPAAETAEAGTAVSAPAAAEPAAEAPVEAPAKAPRRRRAPAKAAAAPAPETAPADEAAVDGVAAAPAPDAEVMPAAEAAEAVENPKAAPKTRSRRRSTKAADAPSGEAAEPSKPAAEPAPATGETPAGEDASDEPSVLNPFAVPALPLFHAPDLTAVRPVAAEDEAPADEDDDDASEASRSRRRSRRGRNRARGESPAAEAGEAAEGTGEKTPVSGEDNAEGVTSRRRRRRRRGDADLELTGGSDDDPPNTVTRVRAPRPQAEAPVSDRVTSVKGSTRLEAKKQRRRESRESGRRRHVITEAEFLARRESVDRQMIVRQRDDRIQIGVLEDGVLAEHFVSNTQQDSLIGNVYVGKVQNVLPSMEAAFVDIGRGRNAVLYAGEVNWDAAGLDGQPRRIELALKSGDSVLVQVTKDPVGHKGARLTSQISLPGRYLVYVPGGSMTGISRKLPDVERNRLKKILKDHLPQDAGVIVRTAAEGASEEELMNDINRLRAQWENIDAKAKSTKTLAPELLYGEPDLTIKVVRDVFNEDFSKLIVSGEEAWDTIEAYVTYVAPDLVDRLEKWTKDEDIFAAHRIDEQIAKALDRKVFLPSGGSLVIDRTEAMTVVDVNTGKFTGSGGNLEETVTKNNLEAAEEVVRQLRLRDIGGIIVIDFIDMVLEANRDLVLRRLVECLGRDRTKHQVAEVTSLGLVQMTRKRMGTGLLEVFGENCEHCDGRGVITHEIPVEHRRSTSHNGSTSHTGSAAAHTGSASHNGTAGQHGSSLSHAVSEDNHQQHLKQEKQTRGDRRRGRGRSQNPQQPVQTPAAEEPAKAEEPGQDDSERQAKAEAARAALATIAAATAAAHDTVGAGERTAGNTAQDRETGQEKAQGKELTVRAQEPAGEEAGAVLRIQGETVVVPRRDRRAPVQPESRFTLESLAAAFNDVAAAAGPEAADEPRQAPEQVQGQAPRQSAGRRGPRRSSAAARSPQGSSAAPSAERDVRKAPEPVDAPAPAAAASAATVQTATAPAAAVRAPRRRRAAGSPQGASGTDAIQTADPAADGGSVPAAQLQAVRHTAAAAVTKQEKRRDSSAPAPVILGVGVPASEL